MIHMQHLWIVDFVSYFIHFVLLYLINQLEIVPPPPFRSCFRYSEEQVVRRIHIKSALIFSRYTSAKPKKDFMKKDLTYNNLLKILEKLRKLRKSCNHKRNITRILDFGVSTIIVLSSRSFQQAVQVGLWTLARKR